MSAKLSAANPYLRDGGIRKRTVARSVATSSAIERIRTAFGQPAKNSDNRSRISQKEKAVAVDLSVRAMTSLNTRS